MKKLALFLLAALAVACQNKPVAKTGLPYFNKPDFTPLWLDTSSVEYQHLHVTPTFSFTDQNGNAISDKTIDGKIYVVDFFFTRCGMICPKMTGNMNKVATEFLKDNRVLLLSHSVTPEMDNVAVLKKYAEQKHIVNPNWHLLTGDKQQIYNIARKGYFAEDAIGYNKDATQFLHTENFILVDKHHHIRGVYNGTIEFEVDNLIRHIKLLEKE